MRPLITKSERLAYAMKERGKIAADLVRELKVSKGTPSNWLNNPSATPKGETLGALCKYLNMSQDWYIHGKNAKDGYPVPPYHIGHISQATEVDRGSPVFSPRQDSQTVSDLLDSLRGSDGKLPEGLEEAILSLASEYKEDPGRGKEIAGAIKVLTNKK